MIKHQQKLKQCWQQQPQQKEQKNNNNDESNNNNNYTQWTSDHYTVQYSAVQYSNSGVSLEAGYRRSTATYVASHCRLLNLTFKRVVVVISSTETGRNNYESLYFIL